MKFIRKNGKIIPIKDKKDGARKDGGADLRKSGTRRYDDKITSKIFKEHGRDKTLKERFKTSLGMGIFGALAGAQGGAIASLVANKSVKKGVIAGAVGLGGFLGLIGASNQRVVSDRKYNKEFGLALKKKKR